MATENKDPLIQKSIFIWIALVTVTILLMPLLAMQFTNEVRWDGRDFVVMGLLLFGTASLFVVAARKTARKRRALVGVIFLVAFLYIWAELAVGVFTNLGT